MTNWSSAKIYYHTQQREKFGAVQATQHYTSLNIEGKIDGYIHAIKNGAKYIYESGVNVPLTDERLRYFEYANRTSGLVYYNQEERS
ncbi:unnamed protein product, partial [Cylicostephanus goldi]